MYYMSKILDLSPEFYRKDGCFPMKSTKHWLKAISFSLALVALSIFVTGCGTFDATDGEKTADAMLEVMNQVQSVETSITLDIQGRFTNGDDTDSDSHTAAVNSTATIESSYSPLACHSQFYSSILVDGAVSREERECYIVPDGSDYIRYDYVPTSSEWTQSKVLRPDALSTPRKTGLIYDWKDFMHGLAYQESGSSDSEKQYVIAVRFINRFFRSFWAIMYLVALHIVWSGCWMMRSPVHFILIRKPHCRITLSLILLIRFYPPT